MINRSITSFPTASRLNLDKFKHGTLFVFFFFLHLIWRGFRDLNKINSLLLKCNANIAYLEKTFDMNCSSNQNTCFDHCH